MFLRPASVKAIYGEGSRPTVRTQAAAARSRFCTPGFVVAGTASRASPRRSNPPEAAAGYCAYCIVKLAGSRLGRVIVPVTVTSTNLPWN